jgi:hypothetical protein
MVNNGKHIVPHKIVIKTRRISLSSTQKPSFEARKTAESLARACSIKHPRQQAPP